jgi:hypothetical protein
MSTSPAPKRHCSDNFPVGNLQRDPGSRPSISSYPLSQRDGVRRAYISLGPFQPKLSEYPTRKQGGKLRRFCSQWFVTHRWLEYSPTNDAVYCFPCFLFAKDQSDSVPFVTQGVFSWNKITGKDCKLAKHVGKHNSVHSLHLRAWESLPNQQFSIEACLNRQSEQQKADHRLRLTASIETVRFLAHQGLAFRGHDESQESFNRGNFLELLSLLTQHSVDFQRVCLDRAPKNATMTSPDIQKDILRSMASCVRDNIVKQIGDRYFCLLIDEARDESTKEQMSLVVRFIDYSGAIQERFLDIIHVADTRSESLMAAIVSTLNSNGLSLCRVRGQGYDGASNMRGEINGLKSIIQRQVPSAFYVHCFAHRLQLALMSSAKSNVKLCRFFGELSSICVTVGASCKRADQFREQQAASIREAIIGGELMTGRGLNQELSLRRPGETRWGTHFVSICRVLDLYGTTVKVLEMIVEDASSTDSRAEASRLLEAIGGFDFVLMLHIMKAVLCKSAVLSEALQRRDQDIVNAMDLVEVTKHELVELRSTVGWKSVHEAVESFCVANNIVSPDMEAIYMPVGRPRRTADHITCDQYYRVEIFFNIIDSQLNELEDRFPEESSILLKRVAYLCPDHLLAHGNVSELVELGKMYPQDFEVYDLVMLEQQLLQFRIELRTNDAISGIRSLSALAVKLVELKKSVTYYLVFRLISLALTLPVSTASSERTFSALKIVKTRLRNKMGDGYLSDALSLYIEKELAQGLSTELIIEKFQALSIRRVQLD